MIHQHAMDGIEPGDLSPWTKLSRGGQKDEKVAVAIDSRAVHVLVRPLPSPMPETRSRMCLGRVGASPTRGAPHAVPVCMEQCTPTMVRKPDTGRAFSG